MCDVLEDGPGGATIIWVNGSSLKVSKYFVVILTIFGEGIETWFIHPKFELLVLIDLNDL